MVFLHPNAAPGPLSPCQAATGAAAPAGVFPLPGTRNLAREAPGRPGCSPGLVPRPWERAGLRTPTGVCFFGLNVFIFPAPLRWAPGFPGASGAAGALGGEGMPPPLRQAHKVPILCLSRTFFRSFFPPSRGPAAVHGTTSPVTSLRANGRCGKRRCGTAPAAHQAPACRQRQRLRPGTGRTGSARLRRRFRRARGSSLCFGGGKPHFHYSPGVDRCSRPIPEALGFRPSGDTDGAPQLWFVMNKRWVSPHPGARWVRLCVKIATRLGRFGLFCWRSLLSRQLRPSWPSHVGTGMLPEWMPQGWHVP